MAVSVLVLVLLAGGALPQTQQTQVTVSHTSTPAPVIECRCACHAPDVNHFFFFAVGAVVLALVAFIVGVFFGRCCSSGARSSGVQVRGKGQWGLPAPPLALSQ